MKHKIRLEWEPADCRKELRGKSDVPYFLKRMTLILYGLVFLTKEIRTICLHTLKRKKEGKGNWGGGGGGSDWKRNTERYITGIP